MSRKTLTPEMESRIRSWMHKAERAVEDQARDAIWQCYNDIEPLIKQFDPFGIMPHTEGSLASAWYHAHWFRGNHPKKPREYLQCLRTILVALEIWLESDTKVFEREESAGNRGMSRQPKDGMSFSDLLRAVEGIVSDSIRLRYPRSWREDTITDMILTSLRDELGNVRLRGLNRPVHIEWDPWKLTNKTAMERRFGDIAVLVNFRSWEDDVITGVGFLEAKRRYPGTGAYDAYDPNQLSRIRAHAPYAFVLLYDYQQVTEFTDNLVAGRLTENNSGTESAISATHALVVPISSVISLGRNTTSLYTYGLPLSYQLCARYLRGFDLDHREEIIREVTGFADNNGGVEYLLVINVNGENSSDHVEGQRGVRINHSLYSRL